MTKEEKQHPSYFYELWLNHVSNGAQGMIHTSVLLYTELYRAERTRRFIITIVPGRPLLKIKATSLPREHRRRTF